MPAIRRESALVAYRVAIDDVLAWSEAHGRCALEAPAIVGYLSSYQQRARRAPATCSPRFLLLRLPPLGQPA